VILEDRDSLDDELQIVPLELRLSQDVVKGCHGGFCGAIDFDDRVAPVFGHVDLALQALHAAGEVILQLAVGRLQRLLLLRMLHDIPDARPLGGLQFLLQIAQHGGQVLRRCLRLADVLVLFREVGVQARQHGGRILLHPADVFPQRLVEPVHADVVAGAALEPAPVVGAAAVGVLQIAPAHGEHRAAAVAAEEKAGVDVVVDLHAPVAGTGALLPQGLRCGEGAVVDDGLVVVFKDQLLARVPLPVLAVDLFARVFALPQRADVKIVV